MRRASLACALLAAVALLAGCGDQRQSADDGGPTSDADADSAARLDLQEPAEYEEPVDLPEGVAATVDGEEIPKAEVEARFEALAKAPEAASRLEGEEGEAVAEGHRAQIVQNLITQRLIGQSAQEMGLEPSEDDLAATEAQVISDFEGDREEFEDALRAEGVTAEQLGDEIAFAARVEAIREVVADEFDDSELDSEATGLEAPDLALHEWFGQRLATADVAVDREYGVWHAETGKVVSPAALEEGSG